MASSTTRLLDRLADALQRRHPASQPALSSGPTTGQTVRLAAVDPPLSRALIDRNLPAFRIVFGLFCVGYSAVTTIAGVYLDLMLALDGLPYARMIAAVAGIVAALVIFAVQLFCAEHYAVLYYVSLIPDTWYSFKPIAWLSDRFAAVDGIHTATEIGAALVVGVTLAFLVARFGEVLLFGARRHTGWWRFALEYLFVLLVCGGIVRWIA